MDIAVAAVEADASAGDQHAVILNNEVTMLFYAFTAHFIGLISVLPSFHRDVAVLRNGLT